MVSVDEDRPGRLELFERREARRASHADARQQGALGASKLTVLLPTKELDDASHGLRVMRPTLAFDRRELFWLKVANAKAASGVAVDFDVFDG